MGNPWLLYQSLAKSSTPLAVASRLNVWELEATWTLRVRQSSLAALLLRNVNRRRFWGSSVWG